MAEHHEVIIVGSGPAGFTAGIYTSRANLDVVVFEGNEPGGQLMITTDVENYPGFPDGVQGPEMMELFRKQSNKFGGKSIYETIAKVDFSQRPFQLWTSNNKHYTADAVIISTGASARRLHSKGEDEYWGFGISACATCDGFFFRNQKVVVIGGGDTAMEEANYLANLCSSVTIIHRRQGLRASEIMAERARKNPKIDFMLDSVVEEYLGVEENGIKRLTGVKVKNVKTGEIKEEAVDGAFIAIGHDPSTKFLQGIIDMDENGYIKTQGKSTYTNIAGVFACGDCQDNIYRQAVTAAGSGCMASIDAERWLGENK
jgi:thioredoxin reductase (NADPH)